MCLTNLAPLRSLNMNGNAFFITHPLCGESIGHQWIPFMTTNNANLWYFVGVSSNKLLNKHSSVWLSETPWRPCAIAEMITFICNTPCSVWEDHTGMLYCRTETVEINPKNTFFGSFSDAYKSHHSVSVRNRFPLKLYIFLKKIVSYYMWNKLDCNKNRNYRLFSEKVAQKTEMGLLDPGHLCAQFK